MNPKKKLAGLLGVTAPEAALVLGAVQDLCVDRGGDRPKYRDITAAIVAAPDEGPREGRRTIVRRTVVPGSARSEPAGESRPDPLIIESARGARNWGSRRPCDDCGDSYRQLWRYAKTNRGPVSICNGCKSKAFARSRWPVDASQVTVDKHLLQLKH